MDSHFTKDQENTPQLWDEVWKHQTVDSERNFVAPLMEPTVRGRKILALVLDMFGGFEKLKVIEVGGGMGTYALAMAMKGAEATVLDYSENALKRAKEYFGHFGYKGHFLLEDVLNLKPERLGVYDIAMSFGLAEHFRYPERLQVFQSHCSLVRVGGLIIVSVPNKYSFSYRIDRWYEERRGKWKVGLEIPFSRGELTRIAGNLDLERFKIDGGSFVGDLYRYWARPAINKLGLGGRWQGSAFQWAGWFDDYLAYTLTLVGRVLRHNSDNCLGARTTSG